MNKKILWISAIIIILTGVAVYFLNQQPSLPSQKITNFEECARAGYPVGESHPRQCWTPDGGHFIEEIPPIQDPNIGPVLPSNECAIAGCSGELCVSADEADDIFTICIYRPEYACYREASCELQANGKCGWTQTTELLACLADPLQSSAPFTISGEIACLPKTGTGPQTMECAIGLKGTDGQYYGLKNLFKFDSEYKFSAGGLRVEVSGTLSSEEIKGPDGNRYDVVGVIDLASIKEIRN